MAALSFYQHPFAQFLHDSTTTNGKHFQAFAVVYVVPSSMEKRVLLLDLVSDPEGKDRTADEVCGHIQKLFRRKLGLEFKSIIKFIMADGAAQAKKVARNLGYEPEAKSYF